MFPEPSEKDNRLHYLIALEHIDTNWSKLPQGYPTDFYKALESVGFDGEMLEAGRTYIQLVDGKIRSSLHLRSRSQRFTFINHHSFSSHREVCIPALDELEGRFQ